jgi:hypothetical protein
MASRIAGTLLDCLRSAGAIHARTAYISRWVACSCHVYAMMIYPCQEKKRVALKIVVNPLFCSSSDLRGWPSQSQQAHEDALGEAGGLQRLAETGFEHLRVSVNGGGCRV